MKARSLPLRCLAVLLCGAIPLISVPAGAGAPTAVLSGTITAPSGATLDGTIRLRAGDAKTGAVYSSEPVGSDGAFEIRSLPASSYHLAVETGAGLYVVETPVRLDAGTSRTVQVAVQPQAASAAGRTNAAVKQPRASFWENPLTATLLVVGAAVVVGIIVDQATDDEAASPSSP